MTALRFQDRILQPAEWRLVRKIRFMGRKKEGRKERKEEGWGDGGKGGRREGGKRKRKEEKKECGYIFLSAPECSVSKILTLFQRHMGLL